MAADLVWSSFVALGCLVALCIGAYCVGEGGDILGDKYDATVIGGFLIAWLNTAPETIFFITALEAQKPDVAIGAMSGSVIVVSTIAFGVCMWLGSHARPTKRVHIQPGVRRQALVLGMTLPICGMIAWTGFSRSLGFIAIFEYVGFIIFTLLTRGDGGGAAHHHHGPAGIASISSHALENTLPKCDRQMQKTRRRGDDGQVALGDRILSSKSSSVSMDGMHVVSDDLETGDRLSLTHSLTHSDEYMDSRTNHLSPSRESDTFSDSDAASLYDVQNVSGIFRGREHASDDEGSSSAGEDEDQPVWKGFAYLAVGGLLIYMFSEPFITAVVTLGEIMEIHPAALAFFLAPIASEAPEILESISLSRKGKTQSINIALSNLVGGTISKTTLLAGILCLYGVGLDFQWQSPTFPVSILLLTLNAGLASWIASASSARYAYHGQILVGSFLITAFIQYFWIGTSNNGN